MRAEICGAARSRRRVPALPGSWKRACAVYFAFLIGKACAALVFAGPDPSDPAAPVPPVIYRPVISPYVSLPAHPGGHQNHY
jgi:hypothetical protein